MHAHDEIGCGGRDGRATEHKLGHEIEVLRRVVSKQQQPAIQQLTTVLARAGVRCWRVLLVCAAGVYCWFVLLRCFCDCWFVLLACAAA